MMNIKEQQEPTLPTIKETLAEKMYRELDIMTGGEFDFEEDYDLFIKAFEKALYDYSLVPTANIIE